MPAACWLAQNFRVYLSVSSMDDCAGAGDGKTDGIDRCSGGEQHVLLSGSLRKFSAAGGSDPAGKNNMQKSGQMKILFCKEE